jgi:hypothetical protein
MQGKEVMEIDNMNDIDVCDYKTAERIECSLVEIAF